MSVEDEAFIKIFHKNHNLDYRIPEIRGEIFLLSDKRKNHLKNFPQNK